jgi:hypothetical protein
LEKGIGIGSSQASLHSMNIIHEFSASRFIPKEKSASLKDTGIKELQGR